LDFFAEQDAARRRSRWLVLWYAVAVLAVVASYCAAAAALYALLAQQAPPARLVLVVALVVGAFIVSVSAYRMWQLSDGGAAIAELLNARTIDSGRCTPAERRLLNVVEEMAIASGISVPAVYVLDYDEAINALVAGYSPNDAVIIVTQGAVHKLSRDELQGIMGHEFSHILNGDMALNLRLVSVLAGLTWFAEAAERLILETASRNRALPREKRGEGALAALLAGIIAFIGFPATFAADAIKGAISRERERLADAAAVQFTRNPDGVAGALDSILALRAHTMVRALHAELFSHMFFAPAAGGWWRPPTHPPILERIKAAHPRFKRDEYRERRHGMRREVAVIDGSGNVVKNVAQGVASVGRPGPEHVDYAIRLLASLPADLRAALHDPKGAEAAMLALARGEKRKDMLALAELAVPALKQEPQKRRDAFIAELTTLVEADRRVTLREFVLLTYLRQRLREGAGQPIRTQFRRIEEVAADAHIVVSLVALSGPDPAAAFAKGAGVLKLGWTRPVERLDIKTVGDALERLRHLAPLVKPALLKACMEAASADGVFNLSETELVRMVAATLDCPVPPALPHA
jgi:Zn-dependent protease with chaperone function/uncharacterized tellurite resistance protein B-like protein